jgi:hypothetical protein
MTSTNQGSSSFLGLKGKLVLIGSGTAVAFVALALTIIPFSGETFSLADIQFLFLNQQEVMIDGKFVDCVATKGYQPCYLGFQSNDGAYFVLTGKSDRGDSRQLVGQEQFQISGKFTSSIQHLMW